MMNMGTIPAEFRPSLSRLLARPIVIAIVMAILVTSISHHHLPLIDFFVFAIFFIIEALYFTPPDPSRYLITISGQAVSGPGSKRHRIALPIDKIDVDERHVRRKWYGPLYNICWLCAKDGERILVYRDAYPKDAFDQMLKIIGDLQKDRARQTQGAQ